MRKYLFTAALLHFCALVLPGQSAFFNGKTFDLDKLTLPSNGILEENFTQAEVYQLDLAAIHQWVAKQDDVAELEFDFTGERSVKWRLYPHDIRSADYALQEKTERGINLSDGGPNTTYRGLCLEDKGGEVRVGISEHFIIGAWEEGDVKWHIEPLFLLLPDAPRDQYVIYREKDVLFPAGSACGVGHVYRRHEMLEEEAKHVVENNEKIGQCYTVPIALAADFSISNFFGGTAGAVNFMLDILNLVQTNFDDEFADEITFQLATTFVSTCSTCDPWSSTTNAGDFLDSFVAWGNGGGFGAFPYSVASLWTNRNFNGPTIGVAYVSGLCSALRYNVLQRFSNNTAALRVLQSHELGHNFGSFHDANNIHIMAPSSNLSNTWSAQSQNAINNLISNLSTQAGCFGTCAPAAPPIAALAAPVINVCTGSTVPFFDISSNGPTSWQWSFPGGTPSSSNEQHPTVTYETPGVYPVLLTVSNASGTDQTFLSTGITVGNDGPRFLSYETFEVGGPLEWTVVNPDGDIGWVAEQVGGTNGGNLAMYVENYNYDAVGQRDALVSPVFDFSLESGLLLEFDYAYRRYSANLEDKLFVYVSTNGGVTYPNQIFVGDENGGGNFATAPDSGIDFRPNSPADWCFGGDGFGASCISLDLSAFIGESNVRIKIENETGFGNNMYVDNVRVSADCVPLVPPIASFSGDLLTGCAPLTVVFNDESSGVVTSRVWNFEGGNPSISTEMTPVVNYTIPGIFDVQLEVTNQLGTDVSFRDNYVNVLGPPTIIFNADINGEEVFFDNLTQDAISFNWNFGDGNTSQAFNPIHNYPVPGTYTVTLEATNECGTSSEELEITIEPSLRASFIADQTAGCEPLTVQFTDTSEGEPSSWNWTFEGGDPATSTERNPVVTFSGPGIYDVSLTVMDENGNEDAVEEIDYITIEAIPEAGMDIDYDDFYNTATFTTTATNADSVIWNFGDGSPDTVAFDAQHDYTVAGTYTVTQIVANECGADTTTQDLTVILPSFSISDTTGCAPLSLEFSVDDPQEDFSYFWTFVGGDPVNSTDTTVTVIYNDGGVYDVILVATDPQNVSTVINADDAITVLPLPDASFSIDYTIGDTSAMFAFDGSFADSLYWDFGDGTMASGDSIEHAYSMDDLYQVTLIAFNDCGSDTSSQNLEIISQPEPSIAVSENTGCAPFTTTFYALPPIGDRNLTYTWLFSGGEPAVGDGDTVMVTYQNPGTYDVQLTATNPAGDSTIVLADYITVFGPPTADFAFDYTIGNDNALFYSTGEYVDSLYWEFGDGQTASGDSINHSYNQDDIYTVNLFVFGPCGQDSSSQEIQILTLPVPSFTSDVTTGCAPLTVQFTASPQAPGYTYAWTLTGGDPDFSLMTSPTVTYDQPGSYPVSLSIVNAAGDSTITIEDYIQVITSPTAGFNVDYTPGDLMASFSTTSTTADSVDWDFGDGNNGSGLDISHTYMAEGDYTVTQTVFNDCGSNTTTRELSIILAPVAEITSESTSGCAPFTVQFNAGIQKEGYQYLWTFEGGEPFSSMAPNPLVTFDEPGTYDVFLVVTNQAGQDQAVATDYITVGTGPTADFSVNVNGFGIQLFDLSQDADTYSWDFGDDSTSMEASPTHTYSENGDYTISLIVGNECGMDTTSTMVTIDASMPLVNFNADVTEGCSPLTVQFNNTTMNGETFEWSFPGGTPSSSTEENPIVVYNQPGTYDVTLIATNSAGSSALNQTEFVTVSPAPVASFSAFGTYVDYDFTNLSTFADSYFWNFGDGDTSTMISPSHSYTAAGEYEVQLIAISDCGADTTSQTINISGEAPTATINADNQLGCLPFTVQYSANVDGFVDSYEWSFPGGTPASSTDPNPTVVYENAGLYTASLSVTNIFGVTNVEEVDFITVQDVPFPSSVDIEQDGLTLTFTVVDAGEGNLYDWTYGDGFFETTTESTVTYTYQQEGNYEWSVVIRNSCPVGTLIGGTYDLFVDSANEPIWAQNLSLFPNPSHDRVWLSAQDWNIQGEIQYRWFNAQGQYLGQGQWQVQAGDWQQELSVDNLPAGVYWLRLAVEGEVLYRRVVKQ